MSIIIGIDPGLVYCGVGVIRTKDNSVSFIASHTIHPNPKDELDVRLKHLHDELAALIAQYQPDVAAMEETFVSANGQSTLKLGQARGALLLTLSLAGLPVHAYSPNLIKKTLTGNGHAGKDQIAQMVKYMLPTATPKRADEADALAIALTHAQHAPLAARLKNS